MDDLDMSGVDPLRYAEMRRRVAVIKEFIATERTPKAVREAFAARVGVGEKQFMRLVATWRALGDKARAASLDGATGGKGGKRVRRGGLSAEARAVVADVIADRGSDAPLSDTLDAVRRLAAERVVTPPSRSSVWNLLMEARSRGAPSQQPPGIVTGVVLAKLPVAAADGILHPSIALAVRSPDGAILAYEVTIGATDATPASWVVHETADGSDCAVEDDGYRVASLLGRRIADIGIIRHPSLASPAAALVRSKRDAPISPGEARRLIAAAVTKHNLAREDGPSSSELSGRDQGGARRRR